MKGALQEQSALLAPTPGMPYVFSTGGNIFYKSSGIILMISSLQVFAHDLLYHMSNNTNSVVGPICFAARPLALVQS